jgi:flagellar hook assembly protein FlgD
MVETWHAVSLQVYDITGKLVATLMDEQLGTGQHTVKWNGTRFSSGVYFLKLEAGSFSQVEKLMLIK